MKLILVYSILKVLFYLRWIKPVLERNKICQDIMTRIVEYVVYLVGMSKNLWRNKLSNDKKIIILVIFVDIRKQ